MQFSKIFLFFCLLAGNIVWANGPISAVPARNTASLESLSCNLPAPFYLNVVAISPTEVTLGWGGSTMYQHQVQIFRASDNALLSTTTVPAGILQATILNDNSVTSYAEVRAICSGGDVSIFGTSSRPFGFIIEAVVSGFQGNGREPNCSITGSGSCTFSVTGLTTFQIHNDGNYVQKFDLEQQVLSDDIYQHFVRLESSNSGQDGTFSFYCNGLDDPDPSCTGDSIEIKFRKQGLEIPVGVLRTDFSYLAPRLIADLAKGWVLDRLESGDRSPESDEEQAGGNVSVVPNPFNETLWVQLPKGTAGRVDLQLFDPGGRQVYRNVFDAVTNSISLPLSDLNPGFYLLRVYAGGRVQTLKVLKS